MIVVAIIGILAAVAIPAFVRYIKKAKTAEATELLRKMSEGARLYFLEGSQGVSQQFPETVGRTPAGNCCTTNKCAIDSTLWQDDTWQALSFEIKDPHFFRYSFSASNGASPKEFVARAEADLDCDGTLSLYELYGEGRPDGVYTSGEPGITRALE